MTAEDEAEIPTFLMLRRLTLSSYLGLRDDTDLARECREAGFNRESCEIAERYLSRLRRRYSIDTDAGIGSIAV